MVAIVNGDMILKDRVLSGHALLYTDKIEGIVLPEDIPAGCPVIDAGGGYIAPGLIDLHIHGYLGRDVCDGSVEGLRTIAKGLLQNGVTGFLPTTMTVAEATIREALESCRAAMAEGDAWEGATVLGAHAEGPFISAAKKGAQDERHIQKIDPAFVKEYADVIRLLTLAPEEDTRDFAAIRAIKRDTDIRISMGHTSADYETAVASTAAGVSHATHLYNAMTPLTHRGPGVVGAVFNTDVSCELIVDGVHVNPALYDMVWKLKGRKLCFITDCLPAGGLPPGNYTLGGSDIVYDGTICRLTDGTIAGSALALNKGVLTVYGHSSIPLYECVNCASLNPATALGIADKKGSLEVGKDADIIIADKAFSIQKTIIGGTIKYESASKT